ncbi:DUF4446 family protein [Candidatus Nomurabacteria bacterium]|nr:DUF4446 family protein [Candidatus Nomurabacteria bacterium]
MSILILNYILAGIIVILAIWILLLERRLKSFFAGTKSKNLEGVLTDISKQITEVKKTQVQINEHLYTVDTRLNKSIRSIQTKRFNPFEDAGSNQSFALSFLNDDGDGVIISSLYARDRMSIFAKPITKGQSEFELSIEEKEVLKKSIK